MSDVAELLESLIAHPGWRLFCDRVSLEYKTRERLGELNALRDTDDLRALNKLRQIVASQEAIAWALEWPKQELLRLKRQDTEPEPVLSRAGANVAPGMSRRGSL